MSDPRQEAEETGAAAPTPDGDRRPTRPRLVALINQKGGVGKTTSTVNLGAALAEAGRRVLLIDLDPQGHLSLHLGIDPDTCGGTVYDVLIDPDVDLDGVVHKARTNLDVVPANVDLAAAESELADVEDRHAILGRKFRAAAGSWDVVLLDCPPSLGMLTLNGLALAEEVIVPMQAHFLALQGLGRLLETVSLVGRGVNPDLRVSGVLLCMHERQSSHGREVVAELKQFFREARGGTQAWSDASVLLPAVRRNIKLAEAPSFGQTILDYAPNCPGAMDYRTLGQRLLERWRKEDERLRGDSSPPEVATPAVETMAGPATAAPAAGAALAGD
jgi:chromosome partitioning protein